MPRSKSKTKKHRDYRKETKKNNRRRTYRRKSYRCRNKTNKRKARRHKGSGRVQRWSGIGNRENTAAGMLRIAKKQEMKRKLRDEKNYRIGLEIEGCAQIDNLEYAQEMTSKYPDLFYDEKFGYTIPCAGGLSRIAVVDSSLQEFEKEKETLPCSISDEFLKVLSEENPTFYPRSELQKGDTTRCSTELILKESEFMTPQVRPGVMYFCRLNASGNIEYLKYMDVHGFTRKVSNPMYAHIKEDIGNIVEKLQCDFLPVKEGEGYVPAPLNNRLAFHVHMSDQQISDKSVIKGSQFGSEEGLKHCIMACLLWYGCPELNVSGFYELLEKEGYNSDGPNMRALGSTYMKEVHIDELTKLPSIKKREFLEAYRAFKEGNLDDFFRYLLETMFYNRTKFVPLNIYNLIDIWYEGEWITEWSRQTSTDDEDSVFAWDGNLPSNLTELIKETCEEGMDEPFRIEFRWGPLPRDNPVDFLDRYLARLTAFFHYSKLVSQMEHPDLLLAPEEWSAVLLSPEEVFSACGIEV
jgi:hypothetical protein